MSYEVLQVVDFNVKSRVQDADRAGKPHTCCINLGILGGCIYM